MRQKDRVRIFFIGALLGLLLVWLIASMRMDKAAREGPPERDQVAEIAALYETLDTPWREESAVAVEREPLQSDGTFIRYVLLRNWRTDETLRLTESVHEDDLRGDQLLSWRVAWGDRILAQRASKADNAALAEWAKARGWALIRPATPADFTGELPTGDWFVVRLGEETDLRSVPDALEIARLAAETTQAPLTAAREFVIRAGSK